MIEAESVHSTPRPDSSLLRRLSEREIDPKQVLTDLFEELYADDPEWLSERVIERLRDAGFSISPAEASESGGQP